MPAPIFCGAADPVSFSGQAMRLLVTRPQPGANETAARLRARGHEALVQPLTRIELSPPPPIAGLPGAIVFTSRNAVRAVAGWEAAEGWRGLPVFTVGAATAAAARDAGFGDVRIGEGDVRRLGEHILADFDRSRGAILYPAARDRAGDLAGALAAAGIAVTTVDAYRAVARERLDAPVIAGFRAGAIDAVLFHARRSATVFGELVAAAGLGGALGGVRLLALSQRVAEPLSGLGAAAVEIAARPDETALLGLVSKPPEDGPAAIPPL